MANLQTSSLDITCPHILSADVSLYVFRLYGSLPGHHCRDSKSFSFWAVNALETCRVLPFLTLRLALGQLSLNGRRPLPAASSSSCLFNRLSAPPCLDFQYFCLCWTEGRAESSPLRVEEAITEFSVSPARSSKTLDDFF